MSLTADGLARLFDAFNRHDIDGVMEFFAGNCVFNGVAGPEAYGTRFEGTEAIAAAFSGVWKAMPDAHWAHHGHFVHGDRAVSEWTFTGTNVDGSRVEAEGCDLFTLDDGKIVRKQAFRKNRPLIAAGA
ncbi:nuclear transport factor 2 family protein (plasmid) [Aminobacter sp. NyZ550]|jgi:ketosteroid isomerase-like protein|uniref:Ketosteroid isomerase-like protein n=1 Tax=Aminobacter ciceronei TaxID=150723 RepID=A0ABR6CJ98_9HYPH|nr:MULTISPECIES: nuclear transport factor 2 family protein [Aminobacter]MBA8910673.1 ketosteroid isomerase-like protein [Aminobacter ciceronei]MBA9024447.1 ketosteroid isomerase-like protein [Aminobacter ciceronei]MRX32550.1 nuclear transport factor 2 family protein [Aminobacter sp. MDW-2]QNH37635.1 nuclear transport factor 2 family protein [Aminobacter sp. MDW-2]QOF74777.1 nuclear transport factor 2 family protein [Aminobacter sp. SR38]